MKIQLLSDTHTEFWKMTRYDRVSKFINLCYIPSDVLVLAGDIAVGRTNTLDILKMLSRQFKNVVYVSGNHEYYGGLELNGFDIFSEFQAKLPSNVHYLNNRSVTIQDVQFHGSTLWTDFWQDPFASLDYQRFIQDYRRIPDATPPKLQEINHYAKTFFKLAYENRDRTKKQVFVSHFLPAYECVSPKWRAVDRVTDNLNKYFANNLDDWIATLDDALWLFGHTHDSVDVMIGQVRCLAAPVGYLGERQQPYQPLVLEL